LRLAADQDNQRAIIALGKQYRFLGLDHLLLAGYWHVAGTNVYPRFLSFVDKLIVHALISPSQVKDGVIRTKAVHWLCTQNSDDITSIVSARTFLLSRAVEATPALKYYRRH
jgi:hypothetical protein